MALNGFFVGRGSNQAWWRRWAGAMRRWFLEERAEPPDMIDIEIDDVAQEVFSRLQRQDINAVVADPQGCLLRLAQEVMNERKRRTGRQGPLEHMRIKDAGPSSLQAPEAARERFESVMRELPPSHREALVLHSNEGLTCSQIAKRQGLSREVVLRKLTRTYAKLRMGLDEQ